MATQADTANPVAVIRQNLTAMEPEFKAALPPHIPVEKFARVAMTAVQQNPQLVTADRRALFGAFVRLAQDGLLPDGREAAVVMFGNKPQAMPMIAGVLKKIRNSGEVATIDCHVVYANDDFTYRPGIDEQPVFEPKWFGDRGEPIGAYAVARLKTGEVVPPEIMNREQIEQVRKVSRAANNGPWVAWWGEMARKTVLRRYSKRLPSSTDLEDQIFARDETMDVDAMAMRRAERAPEPAAPVSRLDAIEHQIGGDEPDTVAGEVIEEQPEISPAEQKVAEIKDELAAAKSLPSVEKIIKAAQPHVEFLDSELAVSLEIAFDQARKRFEPEVAE